MSPVQEVLEDHKGKVLAKIVAMVPAEHKRECNALLSDLESTIEAIMKAATKYAECGAPIEAVLMYFEEYKMPAEELELVNALLEGGYKGGNRNRKRQEGRITASIKVHLNGRGKEGSNPLKKENGLIGLEKWPKEKFVR